MISVILTEPQESLVHNTSLKSISIHHFKYSVDSFRFFSHISYLYMSFYDYSLSMSLIIEEIDSDFEQLIFRDQEAACLNVHTYPI